MPSRTVAIVDDHASVRTSLGEMLSVFGFDVALHESATAFLVSLESTQPGCIVADVRMPGIDGIALVRALRTRCPDLPVILISGHADVPMAVEGIKAGARDFLEKPIDDVQLVAAINRALSEGAEDTPQLAAKQELRERLSRLTGRQIEVFDLVVQGYSSIAIADLLGISRRTVESYRADVMEKMQAESVAVLVRQGVRLGRLTP